MFPRLMVLIFEVFLHDNYCYSSLSLQLKQCIDGKKSLKINFG